MGSGRAELIVLEGKHYKLVDEVGVVEGRVTVNERNHVALVAVVDEDKLDLLTYKGEVKNEFTIVRDEMHVMEQRWEVALKKQREECFTEIAKTKKELSDRMDAIVKDVTDLKKFREQMIKEIEFIKKKLAENDIATAGKEEGCDTLTHHSLLTTHYSLVLYV